MTDKKNKGSGAPSAASKRADQMWVANDELTDEERSMLIEAINEAKDAPTKEQVFTAAFEKFLGKTKLPERLTRTAARAKLSDLAYAKKYLAVKKEKPAKK